MTATIKCADKLPLLKKLNSNSFKTNLATVHRLGCVSKFCPRRKLESDQFRSRLKCFRYVLELLSWGTRTLLLETRARRVHLKSKAIYQSRWPLINSSYMAENLYTVARQHKSKELQVVRLLFQALHASATEKQASLPKIFCDLQHNGSTNRKTQIKVIKILMRAH